MQNIILFSLLEKRLSIFIQWHLKKEIQKSELRLIYSSCTSNFRVILQTAWSAMQVLFSLNTCTLYGQQHFPLLISDNETDLIVDKHLQALCLSSWKFYNTVNILTTTG